VYVLDVADVWSVVSDDDDDDDDDDNEDRDDVDDNDEGLILQLWLTISQNMFVFEYFARCRLCFVFVFVVCCPVMEVYFFMRQSSKCRLTHGVMSDVVR
jgi:hypothetical protein